MSIALRTTWNAWREAPLVLPIPAAWTLTDYRLPDDDALGSDAIAKAVESGLRATGVPARARDRGAPVCILFDDVTRPAAWAPVLAPLLAQLEAAGVARERIVLLAALAAHAPMTDEELGWKLGTAVAREYRIEQHRPDAPMERIDVATGPVGLNALYARATIKIALGSLLPHSFAGFSGGGKAVFPGVADFDSIAQNHLQVRLGRGRVFDPDNDVRRQMDAVARASGLDLLINAVCNGRREIAALFAGPMDATYATGVAFAQRYCATPPKAPFTVLVLNAYPKDGELLQLDGALNVFRTLPPPVRASCRAVVLVARLAKGLGHHAMFAPGGRLYAPPKAVRDLGDRPLFLFAPELSAQDFHCVFPEPSRCFNRWDDCIAALGAMGLREYSLALYHQASMQAGCANAEHGR